VERVRWFIPIFHEILGEGGHTVSISAGVQHRLLTFQKTEITEHHIYSRLAQSLPSSQNRQVLEKIAHDELRHYQWWQRYTQRDVAPDRLRMWLYYVINRVLGLTFGVKLMERGEQDVQDSYEELRGIIPEVDALIQEENEHENDLIQLLDEERLRYTGSIVLGLNDALVELTGALAGLTLALQDTRLIALAGLITGIAAALSMAASEYLSTKSEGTTKDPVSASVYTGLVYLMTVVILISPYLLLQNFYLALGCTLAAAILIIASFTYYISVAQDVPFKERFLEMTGLSLGVALLSFLVGFAARLFLGVEI
jgi:VIT1/CCC1 family predicted Fe2+/Mn2+ transporter